MNQQSVTVREFLRNFRKFTATKKIIIIANHGKPEGVYLPYDEWHSQEKSRQKVNLADLDKFTFHTGDRNFSSRIDEILYQKRK